MSEAVVWAVGVCFAVATWALSRVRRRRVVLAREVEVYTQSVQSLAHRAAGARQRADADGDPASWAEEIAALDALQEAAEAQRAAAVARFDASLSGGAGAWCARLMGWTPEGER